MQNTQPIASLPGITDWIMNRTVAAGCNPELISLLWAIIFTGGCFIPSYFLYRKKIFLKI